MIEKEKTTGKLQDNSGEGISRRTAIRKMGYAAFASSTMFLLLNNPTKVYAESPPPPDGGDDGGGDWDDDDYGKKGDNRGGSYGDYDWD